MKGLTLTVKEQTRAQILNGVLERLWSVREAGEVLGVSERHTWRLLAAYRKEGAAALAHGNRGRVPPNAASCETRQGVLALVEKRYKNMNHTHVMELLAEREGITVSRSTLRRWLVGAGPPSSRHRRPPRHRSRRQRMPQEGMLLQMDGSHHAWLEGRGPRLTLLVAVDDATGKLPYAVFRQSEDTEGYLILIRGIVERSGIPLAIYTDRHAVFQQTHSWKGTIPEGKGRKATQVERALRELGITQIFAHSPEAKGRVERANGTLQDRLVSELRLAGARTLADANDALEEFLPRFNARFGVAAPERGSAYRSLEPDRDVEGILCTKEWRRVAKDNTVQYQGRVLQLYPDLDRPSYAGARVQVQERLDGRLVVCYRGKLLTPEDAPPLAAALRDSAASAIALAEQWPPDFKREARPKPPPGPLAGDTIWYEDPARKHIHRELVRAGMERAKLQGKHMGRPRVTERRGFQTGFEAVLDRLDLGLISRRQAANELSIGYATLKRLLDSKYWRADNHLGGPSITVAVPNETQGLTESLSIQP